MSASGEIKSSELRQAAAAVYASLTPTPLTLSSALSEMYGRNVFLKWENKLRTGSFKERGVVNFLARLDRRKARRGVCSASAGNHALALSYHSAMKKISCKIFMPTGAALFKVQSTRNFGAEVILRGETYQEAQTLAIAHAKKHGLEYVPAFEHPWIIAGQSTCGSEILEQCPQADAIIAPIGGGGLISGIAMAVNASRKKVFLVGARSEWAARQKWKSKDGASGHAYSIADGIAVKQPGILTLKIINNHVDSIKVVTENEIAAAMVQCLEIEKSVIEGAAAAGLAALAKGGLPRNCRNVVVVISGSNLDLSVLMRLLERDMGERDRLLRIAISVPDRPGILHATAGAIAGSGANILQVLHDRSFSKVPGNVEITFLLEVRDRSHRKEVLKELASRGFIVRAQ